MSSQSLPGPSSLSAAKFTSHSETKATFHNKLLSSLLGIFLHRQIITNYTMFKAGLHIKKLKKIEFCDNGHHDLDFIVSAA